MNILLVSQCTKNALTETRRILDQFAERRGDRTWQTPITQAGLETLYGLLRKSARKNTAVACHWIHGQNHSELLWVVGNPRQFNEWGATPTNTTQRNVLRGEDENDWHSLETLYLLSGLAALFHDLGKASKAFQARLRHKGPLSRNLYRHEWVSLRLFQAFVGDSTDEEWLSRLCAPTPEDEASWTDRDRLERDGLDAPAHPPLGRLPPLAQAIGWLMVSHHRLPVMPSIDEKGHYRWQGAKVDGFRVSQLDDVLDRISADWNEHPGQADRESVEPYWTFPHGLPVSTPLWRKRAARLASRLKARRALRGAFWERTPLLDDPYTMHLARLSLMLADHYYSSLTDEALREKGEPGYPLYANTERATRRLNQALDEHLLGVSHQVGLITHALPQFERHLPRLLRHKALRKRSADPRFRWQDHAAELAEGLFQAAREHGGFFINMASTGCGKTLANARIMNAISDPTQGVRCTFALGLRSLTLQTGHAFRDRLGLSGLHVGILVGGAASRALFEHFEREAEACGSASTQDLLPEEGHVFFEGNDDHPLLKRMFKNPQARALLSAPLLTCTVDHLVPATESQRGGHQMAPMLRLMSGDLVLDEIDDYDLDDLPALTRLVYWAGFLGSRLLLSSATLPPALVQGLFEAYRAGRLLYQRHRGESDKAALAVCCAWFDEFEQQSHACPTGEAFSTAHQGFVQQRHAHLGKAAVRRRTQIEAFGVSGRDVAAIRTAFAESVRDGALRLHAAHFSLDPHSQKKVSFGVVRMANIEPLFDVALALYALGAPKGVRVHLCVYHSQFPLVLRSAIERRLDKALDRRKPDAVFGLPEIRARLDAFPEADQVFIVLGSPVTEVGRDHDYDWAIVEPSSMRSLIQLAGRVKRHRTIECNTPNIVVFERNLKSLEQPGKAAFCRPGFETDHAPFRLASHSLTQLDAWGELGIVDARTRIVARPLSEQNPEQNWVDLEHARLCAQMRPKAGEARPLSARERRMGKKAEPAPALNASTGWTLAQAHLTAVLSQQQPFREQTRKERELVLLPDEEEAEYRLHRVEGQRDEVFVPVENNQNHRVDLSALQGGGMEVWGSEDYMEELHALAQALEMPLRLCALRYGRVSLPDSDQGWRFHPALGFAKRH